MSCLYHIVHTILNTLTIQVNMRMDAAQLRRQSTYIYNIWYASRARLENCAVLYLWLHCDIQVYQISFRIALGGSWKKNTKKKTHAVITYSWRKNVLYVGSCAWWHCFFFNLQFSAVENSGDIIKYTYNMKV